MNAEELLKSIEPPLPPEAIEVGIAVMGVQVDNVMSGNQNTADILFSKNGKLALMITAFEDKYHGKDKDAFAASIRNLRQDCQAVCFGTECWLASYNQKTVDCNSPDYVRPTDRPDRTEACVVQLYVGKERHLMLVANIHRNPTRVDDWDIWADTAKPGEHLEGRFA